MSEVKTFREMCEGKPSKAVRSMIEGLRIMDKHPRFEVDMRTFGGMDEDEEMCYGCAATCTILRLTDKVKLQGEPNLNLRSYRANYLDVDRDDLEEFENIIDSLRLRNIQPLLRYMGIDARERSRISREIPLSDLQRLNSDDWKEHINPYKALADKLEELGY